MLVDFINIVVMVKDEERALGGYEEAVMFLKVRSVHAIIFPDLSAHEVETDELMVD